MNRPTVFTERDRFHLPIVALTEMVDCFYRITFESINPDTRWKILILNLQDAFDFLLSEDT